MKWAAWEVAMPVIFYDPPQKKPNAEDKGAGC